MHSKAFKVWKLRPCLGREINCPLLEKLRTSLKCRQLLCMRAVCSLMVTLTLSFVYHHPSFLLLKCILYHFTSLVDFGFLFLLCFLSYHLLFLMTLFPKSGNNAKIVHTHNYQISLFLFTLIEITGFLYLSVSKYWTTW